jgi:hypothetical protein
VRAAIAELNAGAGNQVLNRAGDEYFVRVSEAGDPAADMYCNPCDIIIYQLAFSGV